MLVEINLVRQFMDDIHQLAKQAITVGKDRYRLSNSRLLQLNPTISPTESNSRIRSFPQGKLKEKTEHPQRRHFSV